jgi:hypothetical protein
MVESLWNFATQGWWQFLLTIILISVLMQGVVQIIKYVLNVILIIIINNKRKEKSKLKNDDFIE